MDVIRFSHFMYVLLKYEYIQYMCSKKEQKELNEKPKQKLKKQSTYGSVLKPSGSAVFLHSSTAEQLILTTALPFTDIRKRP